MSKSPTVVLVHGAFADASSWAPVTQRLLAQGYAVAVPPVFNRSLSGDSAYIRSFVEQIDGSVLLVGHSYGGAVITVAEYRERRRARLRVRLRARRRRKPGPCRADSPTSCSQPVVRSLPGRRFSARHRRVGQGRGLPPHLRRRHPRRAGTSPRRVPAAPRRSRVGEPATEAAWKTKPGGESSPRPTTPSTQTWSVSATSVPGCARS